jgi:hypothetical protein
MRVVASIGVSAGVLWALAPWTGILGAAFFGATAAVVINAWRAGMLPGWVAGALAAALSLPAAMFIATMILPWYVLRQAGLGSLTFFVAMVLVWPLVALCLRLARRSEAGTMEIAPA